MRRQHGAHLFHEPLHHDFQFLCHLLAVAVTAGMLFADGFAEWQSHIDFVEM